MVIRIGDIVKGVKENGRLGGGVVELVFDGVKVKDGFEEVNVVRDRVNNGDFERIMGEFVNFG